VADLEILRRDLCVYLTTIARIVNAPLHPFDYTEALKEMADAVAKYQDAAAGELDLSSVGAALASVSRALAAWRAAVDARVAATPDDHALRRQSNAALRRIARLLVPLNYAKGERFDHDPALKFGILPRLEPAASLASAPPEMKRFAKVGLVREMNKVRATLRAVARELTPP
jgi:N-acetylated-alpha-linked acidic dipeptidase